MSINSTVRNYFFIKYCLFLNLFQLLMNYEKPTRACELNVVKQVQQASGYNIKQIIIKTKEAFLNRFFKNQTKLLINCKQFQQVNILKII